MDNNSGDLFVMVFALVIAVFYLVCMWRIFEKAGVPGWMAIIPIVNFFGLLQVAQKPWWWFLLMFIPFVNFVVVILTWHSISENFGHGAGFTLGLIFLSPIFIPIFAFGDSYYIKAKYY
jgi:hypothetical protein